MSTEQISIIIVEDEPEFRRRFAQIIESEPSMRLVGVAANKREAQAKESSSLAYASGSDG